MTARSQKSISVVKQRLYCKVSELNALKLEVIQSIEKSSAKAVDAAEIVLKDDVTDRRKFHDLYGNANKIIEACMLKLLELKDAWHCDGSDDQANDSFESDEHEKHDSLSLHNDEPFSEYNSTLIASLPPSLAASKAVGDQTCNAFHKYDTVETTLPDIPAALPSAVCLSTPAPEFKGFSPSFNLTKQLSPVICNSDPERHATQNSTVSSHDEGSCNKPLHQGCDQVEQNLIAEFRMPNESSKNVSVISGGSIQDCRNIPHKSEDRKSLEDANAVDLVNCSAIDNANNAVTGIEASLPISASHLDTCQRVADGNLGQKDSQLSSKPVMENAREVIEPSVYSSLPVLPVKSGSVLEGIVTYIESPLEFYLHVINSEYSISNMNAELSARYSGAFRPLLESKPKIGKICAALSKYSNCWMRAIVLGSKQSSNLGSNRSSSTVGKEETVNLHYIDFGFNETHPLSDIRELDGSFLQTPALAINCRLHGIVPPPPELVWGQSIIMIFRDLPQKQIVKAKVHKKIGCQFEVELFLTVKDVEVSIADCLLGTSIEFYAKNEDDPETDLSPSSSPPLNKQVEVIEQKSQVHDRIKLGNYIENSTILCDFNEVASQVNFILNMKSSQVTSSVCSIQHCNKYPIANIIKNVDPADLIIHDLKLPQNFTTIEAMVATVVSPDEFYIHPLNEIVARIDVLGDELFARYSTSAPEDLDPSEISTGSFWCVRFPSDGRWYRGKVLKKDLQWSARNANERIRLLVFYVDYGDSVWVSANDIRRLDAQFYELPALAVRCRLYNISPKCNPLTGHFATEWAPQASAMLREWAGEELLNIHVFKFEDSTDIKVYEVLLWHMQQFSAFHDKLIQCGWAVMNCIRDVKSNLCPAGDEDGSEQAYDVGDHDEMLEEGDLTCLRKWDPMNTDFRSLRNSYKVDIEDPGVALTGYKARDEIDICMFYQRGQVCKRGNFCPFKHIKPRPDGLTTDKKKLACITTSFELPAHGNVVSVEVTALVAPFNFYVHLTLKPPDTACGEEEGETSKENLHSLWKAMQTTYEKTTSFRTGDYLLRALGELVAAKYSKDNAWYRGIVTEVNPDGDYVRIFFVDYGDREWIAEHNVRDLEPEFMHLPFQAIECRLANVEISSDEHLKNKAKKFFLRHVENKNLLAQVQDVIDDSLVINLFTVISGTTLDIGAAMVNAGFAKYQNRIH